MDYKSERNIWSLMKQRCFNKKNKNYNSYGGRGVTVCDEWVESFDNFLKDMGERPTGTTLDRINNDLSYSSSNCRWADSTTQSRNKGGYKNNNTGVKGVYLHTKSNKFIAQISVNKKRVYLGSYNTLESAKLARYAGELIYWH